MNLGFSFTLKRCVCVCGYRWLCLCLCFNSFYRKIIDNVKQVRIQRPPPPHKPKVLTILLLPGVLLFGIKLLPLNTLV